MNRPLRLLLVPLLAMALIATSCGDDDDSEPASSGSSSTDEETPAVSIGAQDFGESAILAEIYKQGLEAKGFDVSIQDLGGYRDLEIAAFDKGEINFAPEYAASMLEFLNKKAGEASGDVAATVTKLKARLKDKSLVALESSDAVDTNAFVVTKATAEKLGLKTLSDLASKGKDLKLGGPADCETNPFCLPGLKKVYGLDLAANFTGLEAVGPSLDGNAIDVGVKFSTDGDIDKYVVLTDDKGMLAADNIIPVVTEELAGIDDLVSAIDAISTKLTTELLAAMNKRFNVDKDDAAVIAKDFLEEYDLL